MVVSALDGIRMTPEATENAGEANLLLGNRVVVIRDVVLWYQRTI